VRESSKTARKAPRIMHFPFNPTGHGMLDQRPAAPGNQADAVSWL
jgi:hypothetical protein